MACCWKAACTSFGEAIVAIKHCLIGCEGASLQTIRTVASHPVALAQCQRFFAAHPLIRPVAADDTAGSVRHVMETADPMLAAIASANAAQIYGGKILARISKTTPRTTPASLCSPVSRFCCGC